MSTRTVRTPGIKPAASQPIEQTPQVLPEGLPNAIDIDCRHIEAPVLTRQGWVVPDEGYRKALQDAAKARDLLAKMDNRAA